MDIKPYFAPLLKWWKLIALACVLSAISSFLLVIRQPPIFQTRTTLVIGRAVYEPNPTTGEIGLATQLATYYADIVQRDIVRNATREALNLTSLPTYTAAAAPNSQIIEILVTDTSPQRAQAVANELARQLMLQTPSNPEQEEQKHQEFINQQMTLLEAQIQETLDKIAELEAKLGGLTSARQISDTQSEISTLQQKLLTLQTNYAAFLGRSTGRALNSLSVIEPAALPTRPVGPNRIMVILLSVVIAFLITSGAAYAIEYLDDSLKTPEDITKALNLPIVGYISEMGKEPEKGLYVAKNPTSAISEAFRALRINLDFIEIDQASRVFLIVSADKAEGKTVVAANLAQIMAQGGVPTILVDADLRMPSVSKYLSLPDDKGLSDLFRDDTGVDEVILKPSQENLSVITSGSLVSNPADLLGSRKMNAILDELKSRADVIIIDCPPVMVSDATLLSTKVDGVLMVVGYGLSHKSDVLAALKQLNRVGAKVIGVVFNRIPAGTQGHYYGLYRYYSGARKEAYESTIGIGNFRVKIPRLAPLARRIQRVRGPKPAADDQPGVMS
jgi:non-specific protein-tyrosine kinase